MNIPLYVHAQLEEVLPNHLLAKNDLVSLSQHSTAFPVDIIFNSPCDSFELEIDPIPRNTCITLDSYIHEPCVLVSGGSKAHALSSSFLIPLRTQVSHVILLCLVYIVL